MLAIACESLLQEASSYWKKVILQVVIAKLSSFRFCFKVGQNDNVEAFIFGVDTVNCLLSESKNI